MKRDQLLLCPSSERGRLRRGPHLQQRREAAAVQGRGARWALSQQAAVVRRLARLARRGAARVDGQQARLEVEIPASARRNLVA